MPGYADVEVARIPHALVIPRACVLDGKVVVRADGKRQTRSVEVLATDGTIAAIGAGLAEGEWVLLHPEE